MSCQSGRREEPVAQYVHYGEFEVTSAYFLPEIEINIHVGLAEMQRKWYRSVLEKDIDAVNGLTGHKEGIARLMNIVMQVCFYPLDVCR